MPFKKISRGTNGDGSESNMYCSFCIHKGVILHPSLTKTDMYIIGVEGVRKTSGNIMVAILKIAYPKQLNKLEYWKNDKSKINKKYTKNDVQKLDNLLSQKNK